ncbi:MAG: prolipoprotein diacylglyceryl transferase [Sphingomonadaceae bacterium]|nr:prolipoprotein diacylglyceryl transferase [Sphingomonadaceae bacterium]MCB2084967.1 prolipoprotein diacylglyceryl transferase [Sphingomonadaceae bacterium]MCP5390233.1 prolipoprotein diacylglyceryl transferase [Sphingomonadaceae bacterium]MCP5392434.1 prolipoprotein diacylglyceryl transferase [Sphingomonadaceae bacterium]
MLSLLAATSTAAVSNVPLEWTSLGLSKGIDLGFFELRFYSLAYLFGILFAYWHLSKMIRQPGAPMAQRHVEDLFFYCFLGVILGGRLGYAAFYDQSLFGDFTGDGWVSWKLLRLWDGGMSFHGGLIGVVIAIGWVSWREKLSFIRVCDYVSVNVPVGMFLGRLANFVNGELYGRVTDVPWAMSFPEYINGTLINGPGRHPSQLYQAGLEGLALILIMLFLFWKTRARYRTGFLVATFATGMGLARFINEFFREPDAQLLEFAQQTGLSMGQWLSIPLILAGLAVMVWTLRRPEQNSGKREAGDTADA